MINIEHKTEASATLFELEEKEFNLFKEIANVTKEKIQNKLELFQVNKMLAGQIEHEYLIDQKYYPQIQQILSFALDEQIKKFPSPMYQNGFSSKNLKIVGSWINLQKKHEYNPLHYHSGSHSFVIWVDVPFYSTQEKIIKNSLNSANPRNGDFYFAVSKNIGGTDTIQCVSLPVDKTYEGKGIIFPSLLAHGVNPFYTSDEYRISISGNYIFDLK